MAGARELANLPASTSAWPTVSRATCGESRMLMLFCSASPRTFSWGHSSMRRLEMNPSATRTASAPGTSQMRFLTVGLVRDRREKEELPLDSKLERRFFR